MDLDAGEAGALGQARGCDEAALDLGDFEFRHRARHRKALRLRAKIQCDRGRRQCLLAQARRHLAAGMVDLHPDLRAMRAGRRGPGPEAVEMALVLQHHAAGTGHGAGIDHHVTGDDQTGLAFGPGAVEIDQLGRGGVVGIGHVLLHRGLGDAVGDDGAVGQCQR